MAITTTGFSKLLWPGQRKVFIDTLNWAEKPPQFKTFFNVVDSTRAYEETSGFAGFGKFNQKEEGTLVEEDTTKALWTKRITNYTFARRYRVTWEAYNDDQYGLIKKYGQALARAARTTIELDPATMITAGNAASPSITFTTTTGDGQYIFASTHTNYDGTNDDRNIPSTAAALSPSTLQTAITDFKTCMVDSRGLPLMIAPKYLVVPPALEFTAKEILQSVDKPYTADNTTNVLRDYQLQLVVWDWLAFVTMTTADSNNWFLFSAPSDNGLTWQWRAPISDFSFDDDATFDAWYGARYRRGLGCDTWQGIYGVFV